MRGAAKAVGAGGAEGHEAGNAAGKLADASFTAGTSRQRPNGRYAERPMPKVFGSELDRVGSI